MYGGYLIAAPALLVAMSLRFVVAVTRASGIPTALVNPKAAWSPRLVRDVIDDISSKRHQYVVFVPPFRFGLVNVVRSGTSTFLRTTPDADRSNNLALLPEATGIPREYPVRVRKNAADLTQEERVRFVAAVLELRNKVVDGDPDGVNWWFKWDQVHSRSGTHTHSVTVNNISQDQAAPAFLAWHRVVVNEFEKALQAIDPDITVPYWDWTTDPRRTPDRSGRLVDLMTADFMGAARGEVGPPFTSLYASAGGGVTREATGSPAAPPATLRRLMPVGKGPREVATDDLDWSDQPAWGVRPAGMSPVDSGNPWIPDDRGVLWDGFGGDRSDAYRRLLDDLYLAHSWCHRFVGGDIALDDFSRAFRDPFVFLIHSNVDRLYASWQLRQQDDRRDWAWRLDSTKLYGTEDTHHDLKNPLNPWSGGSQSVAPWTASPPLMAKDPSVVRPPLYDKYAYDDELTCSWSALLMGKRLPNGDRVEATIQYDVVPAGSVDIQLVLGPALRWWKSVTIADLANTPTTLPGFPGSGTGVRVIEAEDDNRGGTVRVATASLPTTRLLLSKQVRSWFWIKRELQYQLGDLEFLPDGSRLVLSWVAD